MDGLDQLILLLPIFLFSVVAHEYAHARVAVWQGDPTPAALGRVTLNPLPHLDLVGSLLVPAALWLMPGSFLFGWARPVPVDAENFDEYRRGDILVSLAGVTANFLVAAALLMVAVGLARSGSVLPMASGTLDTLLSAVRMGIFFNLLLGVFNLIPVPPLDGSHVLYHLLPVELGERYRQLGKYGMLLLIGLLLLPGLMETMLAPVWALMDGADALIVLLS